MPDKRWWDEECWEEEKVHRSEPTVLEHAPVETGLLDQHGRKLMRQQAPFGFRQGRHA